MTDELTDEFQRQIELSMEVLANENLPSVIYDIFAGILAIVTDQAKQIERLKGDVWGAKQDCENLMRQHDDSHDDRFVQGAIDSLGDENHSLRVRIIALENAARAERVR